MHVFILILISWNLKVSRNYHIQSEFLPETLEKRWEIMRHYFEKHDNVVGCVRKFLMDFQIREAPSAPHVRYLVKKSERN